MNLAVVLLSGIFALCASTETETAAKAVADQKLRNQLSNGDFSSFKNRGTAPGWTFWKGKDSRGKVQFEKTAGVDQSPAAVLSGGNIVLFSFAEIQGGETIYVRLKTKKSGGGDAGVSVRFQTAGRKWLPLTVSKPVVFSASGGWTVAELVVKAPADAKIAVPMFSIKNIESPESRFVLDDVELYIIRDPEKGLDK